VLFPWTVAQVLNKIPDGADRLALTRQEHDVIPRIDHSVGEFEHSGRSLDDRIARPVYGDAILNVGCAWQTRKISGIRVSVEMNHNRVRSKGDN